MLGEIVGARNGTFVRDLNGPKQGKKYGKIKIISEEIAESARKGDTVVLDMRGIALAAKDGMFGKSDPYLIFKRKRIDGAVTEIFRTEIITQNLDPHWKQIRLDLIELCNGDLKAPIIIECWDYDTMSSDDSIGDVTTSLEELLSNKPLTLLDRQNRPQLQGKCGTLVATTAKIYRTPTFLDYISMGCSISLTVAVDFTGSNGEPTDYTSLHHIYNPTHHSNQWNEYQQAIIGVGEILVAYDSDQMIPAFGFGGIPPGPSGQVSFCFPLNGDGVHPEVKGVQGLLDAYASSIQNVKLYGPTNMAEIIRRMNALTRETLKSQQLFYNVLMILTDGEITDMPATVDAIVESSSLPISIIIIGVQNQWHVEDFISMKQLDGDDCGLVDGRGKKAARDVVQFVPFNSNQMSMEELSRQVLAEVPSQLVDYFGSVRRKPDLWSQPPFNFYELRSTLPNIP